SPHRIQASLADLQEVFGWERRMVMAREISKAFETFLSGTIGSVLELVNEDPNQQKGEIVFLVGGYQPPPQQDGPSEESRRVMTLLLDADLPVKQAATLTSAITGEKKNRLYDWALTR